VKPSRYALVTGASRGIGIYFARALAARSWNLIVVARSKDRLEELASDLSGSYGVQVEVSPMDLTGAGAPADVARIVAERGLDVELLVNNAGHGDRGRIAKLSAEDQSNVIQLNVQALVELTRFLLPAMIAKGRGGIINVSSTAGFQPMPSAAVYAASKAFVTSFSMALAEEVRGHGITVVTLCPGPTQTSPPTAKSSASRFPGGFQPAEELVEQALQRLDRGGGLVVPRFINKLMAFSNRLMPLHVAAKLVKRAMRPPDE
jgi:short-subunit dehydrogenase